MVNKRSIHQAILRLIFQRSSERDKISWHDLVDQLVHELKVERAAYYGNEGSPLELAYPGFDYTSRYIRWRLERYPYHNRLYKAFDVLRLTSNEIESVVIWWGTKAHRRNFERTTRQRIKDTLEDDIPTVEDIERTQQQQQALVDQRQHQELLAYTLQQAELENMMKSAEYSTIFEVLETLPVDVLSENVASQFPHLLGQHVNYAV